MQYVKQSNTSSGKKGSVLKEIFMEHVLWKHQIFKLAKADLIKTYSGSALGWAWALIKPTVTILVFWFAFTVGLRHGKDYGDYPYILWLISGMVPWFCISEMFTQGAGSIRRYKFLVTKMKFPISTIPTFTGIAKLAVHLCLMAIVIVIFALFGFFPDRYMLQLPVYTLFLAAFFTAWSLFSGMLASISQDFLNLVKSVTTAIFWMSAIMWDVNKVSSPLLRKVLMANPITYIVSGYRDAFIYKRWFWDRPAALLCFLGMLCIMTMMAVWSYKKLIREIPDVL